MDMDNKNIKKLFFRQIRDLTLKKSQSFDLQFSDLYQDFQKEESKRCLI